ncbi:MAG: hydroxyphenylacetyl-CoA thioesterase PaaI [Gammaproteobacteria bacterium]|nr:hydroxyphenylacetyl-CoA thioesterase PaaI [Gammaproteobacteria bacterium]
MNRDSNELAEGCIQVLYGRDSVARALAIQLLECGPGHALLSMQVRQDMCNGHGICHGGMLFTLADTAMAYASNSYGLVAVASSVHIDYLRSVTCGEYIRARAEEVYRGRSKGSYRVYINNAAEVQVAHFYGTVAIRSAKVLDQAIGDST